MDIFVYSDESGVFDFTHNDYFVYAGIICFGKDEKEILSRKYSSVERIIRRSNEEYGKSELKAIILSNSDKGKIYRSLNNTYKFTIIIDQKKILKEIFDDKKSKQRYLDYAYKIGLKKCFEHLIAINKIVRDDIENIFFSVDEHTTATNGKYELREALLREFKIGTFNYNWERFFEPVFPNLKSLLLSYCDSNKKMLIRAADIIANKIYHSKNEKLEIKANKNLFVFNLPR